MTGEIKLNSLNILHISDAHIQLDAKEEVSEIVVKMINDALKVQKEQDIKIDLVCFTGDLIQRGDKALDDEKQLEIAEEILVNPLLNSLGLENNKFIIIPGNHEVDVKKIVKATEKGLLVDSLEEINDNVSDMNESYLARLDYFYQWIDNYYDDIIREKIGYAFLREINGKKIGIACIDSAWRSSGKGGCEKGIMYVGQKQINDLYKHIKDADIKICLMHHPTDWLSDYESTIIERELTKFDIVLRGHVHENDHKEVCRQSMKTIYSTAGKIYPLDYAFGRAVDGYNGYSILNIDFNNSLCNIFLRTYYAKDRNDFDSAINLVENGQVSYPLNGNIAEKQMEFNIVNGIHNYFTNMSETLSLIKEIDTYSPLDIEEVFVEPILSEESEYVSESSGKVETICLDELLDDTDNVILFGKKESGKTTILQQIGLKYIDKYNELEIIPVHIDMRNLPKKSDKLTNAAVYFVMKNMFDDATIRKEKVKELIDNGKIVFLIDNIDISNANHTVLLSKFIEENSGKELFLEMIKVSFPIALQHVILENVGTPKLEVAIDELMEQKKYKPFEKFMLEFLKCDLNVGNVIPELHRYIQKETSEGIIKLIIMKLLFYYRMRFFGTNKQIYNGILDLIIEAQIKLNMNKDLTKVLKGNKSLVRKELAKQIENNPNINL